MKNLVKSRRRFLKATGLAAGAFLLSPRNLLVSAGMPIQHNKPAVPPIEFAPADYTLRIKSSPVEIAPKRIISVNTYNGQFPGPLLRFKEGQQVTVDVYNDTDTPEQLHWHGQMVPTRCRRRCRRGHAVHSRSTANGASCSRRGRRDSVSITPTTALAQTSLRDNTAARSGRCTLSRDTNRVDTTAKSFSC